MSGSLLNLERPEGRELFEGAPLTGNLAKVKVLTELERLLEGGSLDILDVGCAGLKPLEFWEPLLDNPALRFHLTGIDLAGIDRAVRRVSLRGWQDRVKLRQGSGYELARMFGAGSFDVVVATQVVEHIACLDAFLAQVAAVLAPGGEFFLTTDSGHFAPRFSPRHPLRLAKNVLKKLLALAGDERHFDLPYLDRELAASCRRNGLEPTRIGYYNLPAVKFLHNHLVCEAHRNETARLWFELEEALNREPEVRARAAGEFLCLYVRARGR